MTGETELTTVYRSADSNAEQDALAIQDLLLKGGFNPEVFNDNTPGVVEGTYEVRVPRVEAMAAESLIGSRATADDPEPGDPTEHLDPVTVASTDGTTGEMEATAIKSMLDANDIPSLVVGNTQFPSLGFEVRVAREDGARAEAVIADAEAAGPLGALEAEQSSE